MLAGCGAQFDEQGRNIARNAWLQAGLPCSVPAMTLDRKCGSSQEAVNLGAALIASGARDVVVAAGVEHMGHISFAAAEQVVRDHGDPFSAELRGRYDLVGQGTSAEMIAEHWQLPRAGLDAFALRSHERALTARTEGRFERETIGVDTEAGAVTLDEGPRPDTSLDRLAALRPAFAEDGVITAGNSSQISDGAAAVLLMDARTAADRGLTARARIVDHVAAGVDPCSC